MYSVVALEAGVADTTIRGSSRGWGKIFLCSLKRTDRLWDPNKLLLSGQRFKATGASS
jgi:hypothetical protein